jgi:D-amino peptidase
MSEIKRIYMMTDLEGVAGVDDWDPRRRDYASSAKGVDERTEMRRLLTDEVNAAAQGLLDAGVEEVLINDAHGAGRTILPEELIPGVRLARGVNRPSWLLGASPRFDALVQVGMHAMAGTPNACLCHSMSIGYVFSVNGRELGEMEMAALLAGTMGIPWIFTSGDGHACREAESWVPRMVSAPVKEGLAINCAIHLSPGDAWELIHTNIQRAVAQADGIAPLRLRPGPVEMEIQREAYWEDPLKPAAQRVNDTTIRYAGDSFWEVFHAHFYGRPDFPIPAK